MVTTEQFTKGAALPAQYSANASLTIRILNEIFAEFPGRFRFTSGYRTPAQNTAAGGVAGSYHLKGLAGDFVPVNGKFPAGEKAQIGAIVSKYGFEVIQHNAGSGLHYHIEPMPGANLTIPAQGNTAGNVGVVVFLLFIFILASD